MVMIMLKENNIENLSIEQIEKLINNTKKIFITKVNLYLKL